MAVPLSELWKSCLLFTRGEALCFTSIPWFVKVPFSQFCTRFVMLKFLYSVTGVDKMEASGVLLKEPPTVDQFVVEFLLDQVVPVSSHDSVILCALKFRLTASPALR